MTATTIAPMALDPVRARLLSDARSAADRALAAALAEAGELLRQARGEAERAASQARARGQSQAAPAAAAERARGRHRARSIVLTAQRDAYEELRREVLTRAGALRNDPGYPGLLTRLAALAVDAAGPGACVTFPDGGGARARSGEVVADCSLPRLAELALQALGGRARELWCP
jgi:vacuolar-type H+-ATPase subunit E/Vma4